MGGIQSFSAYLHAVEQSRVAAEEALRGFGLDELDRFAMKVAYVLEEQVVPMPEGKLGTVLGAIISKLTNEVLSFSGALRMGAAHGAWHHVRAVMELDAAVHYLFDDDRSQTAKRVEQFIEFGEMAPWSRRRRLEIERDDGRITDQEFQQRNIVSDALIAHAVPERIACWKQLFSCSTEKQLTKRRAWHDGSLKSLFDAVDQSGDRHHEYEVLCHPTHVSPLGHRLSGGGPPRLFGYAPPAAEKAIAYMFGNVYRVLERLNEQFDGAFNAQLAEEVEAFLSKNGRLNAS